MNYVILDMEWDSSFYPKEKRFINQIIQIGAVKLDEKFSVVDTFDVTVRSSFSKKVSGRFTELTGITNDDMRSGIPLGDAVVRYNEWVGDGSVLMTWSTSDLYTMIENEKSLLDGLRFKMDMYLDLQKYIQNEMKLIGLECKSQISLEHAAQALGVDTAEYSLHTAKDDSLVCAALLKKFYCKERFSALVKDAHNPEFFERLYFKAYYISDLDSDYVDRDSLNFKCPRCERSARRVSKWRFKNYCFTARFYCNRCKFSFFGRVSFKKTYDNVIVKKRAVEPKPKVKEEKTDEMQPVSASVRK